MARDIHNVADDVSLVMREVIDATENEIVLQTSLHLNKGAKSDNAKDYIKTQVASKRQLNNKLQQVANKSQKMLNNVIDNIGSYTGTDTKALKKDTALGMKMLVKSAKSMQNKTLKKVSRLERYRKSSNFIADLNKSIVEQSKLGIDKGLPVTYKNGRKVTYKAYMEMAVRTGIQQEIGNRQLETGGKLNIVFYVVNEFGDCADDHANYQGRMYYDERYQDFPLQDEIKSLIQDHIQRNGLLSIQAVRDNEPYLTTRPNCRHKMKPVAIDKVLQENVEDIKKDLGYKSKSYRPENYEAVKTQRYNERNIRKYKQRNLTYMEIYKKTNNKDYLLLAQKEKRKVLLWQKRHREHLKLNPDLKRGVLRENPRVLLQDLGLTNKKIQVDPNKPPTPITNKPPQNPPVPMSATVQEHLEMPEQDLTSMLTTEEKNTSLHQVFTGRNLIEERNIDPEKDANDKEFLSSIYKAQEYQEGFDGVPLLQSRKDFEEGLKKSPYMLFRGYSSDSEEDANDFREDMEKNEFYVDNSGGSVCGRGMYFAYNSLKEKGIYGGDNGRKLAVQTAVSYSKDRKEEYRKIDIAYINQDAKIGKESEIIEEFEKIYTNKALEKKGLQKEHTTYNNILKKFDKTISEKEKKIKTIKERNIKLYDKQDDLRYEFQGKIVKNNSQETYDKNQNLLDEIDELQKKIEVNKKQRLKIRDEINVIADERKKEQQNFLDNNLEYKYLKSDFDWVINQMDTGVAGTLLGYDGYTTDTSNYFVLLNRSKVVLLNNNGDVDDPIIKQNYIVEE